jgi:hypothetical protein
MAGAPDAAAAAGCVGPMSRLYSGYFPVIFDDGSGFARTGGRSAEEIYYGDCAFDAESHGRMAG